MLNDIRANNRAPAGRGTAAQIAVTSVGVGPRAHRAGRPAKGGGAPQCHWPAPTGRESREQ